VTPKHIVAAAALVTNEDDHVLMIYSPYRGWETPGGQVEQGEDLLAGLLREIREESGVVAAIGPLVGLYSNLNPAQPILIAGFLARYVSGQRYWPAFATPPSMTVSRIC
jgi:8-oxo-dGTP pyrophosphatase MutT (NUDIX family)